MDANSFPGSKTHVIIREVSLVPSNQIQLMVDAMLSAAFPLLRYSCVLLLCVSGLLVTAHGQREQRAPDQPDDVLRINSDLAQTDVMVFDKQGRFVDNLKRDQFELKIDGKSKPIAFFDSLKSGSPNEDAQLAAARGDVRSPTPGQEPGRVVPLDRGRVVLFFVDDLHLAAYSMKSAHALLRHFIDIDFGQNDEAAITSASGQLGFLQQVTGDKAVLLAAINRLRVGSVATRDFDRPPMSESQALAIEKFDQEVTDFFVDRFLADNPGIPRPVATEFVRKRAEGLLQQAAAITNNTLHTLLNLIRSVGEMPQRKVLFFISDGFLIDDQTSNVTTSLRRITDAAARAGVVIYSMDARGLSTGLPGLESNVGTDASQRLTRTSGTELTATQAPLRSLSADTGGRALLNTNALSIAVTTVLDETAAYYVLAWRPDTDQQANKFRRIEVSIVGHPELVVRVRRGFIERDTQVNSLANAKDERRTAKLPTTEDALLSAIQSRVTLIELPTSLFVSFADDKTVGSYVTVSMEMESQGLDFAPAVGQQTATVDVAGIIFNDQGKRASSFKSQLSVHPPSTGSTSTPKRGIAFNYQARLKAGLYQVRVAARDVKSGRSGSAVQWIEVPDLTLDRLSLSSVVIGERPSETSNVPIENEFHGNVFVSISRRFAPASNLRFLTHIYNASRGADGNASPDVALQVQIFRDNQPIMTTALSKVDTKGVQDLKRLPYAADIPLSSIPAGRYRLQVTVIDRIAKTSATQHVSFEIG